VGGPPAPERRAGRASGRLLAEGTSGVARKFAEEWEFTTEAQSSRSLQDFPDRSCHSDSNNVALTRSPCSLGSVVSLFPTSLVERFRPAGAHNLRNELVCHPTSGRSSTRETRRNVGFGGRSAKIRGASPPTDISTQRLDISSWLRPHVASRPEMTREARIPAPPRVSPCLSVSVVDFLPLAHPRSAMQRTGQQREPTPKVSPHVGP
jgi:hypothetical protein